MTNREKSWCESSDVQAELPAPGLQSCTKVKAQSEITKAGRTPELTSWDFALRHRTSKGRQWGQKAMSQTCPFDKSTGEPKALGIGTAGAWHAVPEMDEGR